MYNKQGGEQLGLSSRGLHKTEIKSTDFTDIYFSKITKRFAFLVTVRKRKNKRKSIVIT
jgi:hypothetical protein